MASKATQDINQERRAKLEAWFERIWRDGSYVHWVNPKTQRLHVGLVAEKLLGTTDTSIFSGWAKSYRENFNRKHEELRKASGALPPACDATGQFGLPLGGETPDELLDEFMNSELVKNLGEFDEDALRSLLNSYQALSCERYLVKIDKLQNRNKELEAQIKNKDRKLALLSEKLDHIQTNRDAEESHFLGSIRNIYSYDAGEDL